MESGLWNLAQILLWYLSQIPLSAEECSMNTVHTRVVKADFLKAVRKAVSERLVRLLKGWYTL